MSKIFIKDFSTVYYLSEIARLAEIIDEKTANLAP